jgi:hypothetical protein
LVAAPTPIIKGHSALASGMCAGKEPDLALNFGGEFWAVVLTCCYADYSHHLGAQVIVAEV